MTDFPADVETHYRRLAAQRHWPLETEAAFRASVAWYRALDESSELRRYYEHVDHEGLVDEGARWLWEAIVVNHETVAIRQIELDSSGAVHCYWWRNIEDDVGGLTDQALDLADPKLRWDIQATKATRGGRGWLLDHVCWRIQNRRSFVRTF